ncbi:hypothetical protein SLE2022_141780 [Rubroshorea leprosula]
MCRGFPEGNRGISSCLKQGTSSSLLPSLVRCELCNSRASLYCPADDAFLCRKCDRWRYLIGASTEVVLPTIVSLMSESQGRRCDSDVERECSTKLKTPFLSL